MKQDFIVYLNELHDPTEESVELLLKPNDSLKAMVKMIQKEKSLNEITKFCLHIEEGKTKEGEKSNFWNFYEHEHGVPDDESSMRTVSEFFDHPHSATVYISFVNNKDGKSKDIMISNATNESFTIKVVYESMNKIVSSIDTKTDVDAGGSTSGGNLKVGVQKKKNYDQLSLAVKKEEEAFQNHPHKDGFTQQQALKNGHLTGCVEVQVYRDVKVDPINQFNVEPDEHWILFYSKGTKVIHGKAKRKSLFTRHNEIWRTKDGLDRNPHACLGKDKLCKVCLDPAQIDGPYVGKPDCKPHAAGKVCEVCGYSNLDLDLDTLAVSESVQTSLKINY